MAYRLARKVKRAGKGATQFRFTSTLEYIEVACKGTWRPEQLRVIWLRSHRRVHSQAVQWVATDDQGPNGAEGKAVFDPPIAISLIVTLYRDIKKAKFDTKEYKYYIQNEGMGGKKILAAFTANLAEFIDVSATKHHLSMKLEPMSKKISQAILALTIETEFVKEGRAEDDDMQSTFSAVSLGEESLQFDDDDDLDEDEMDEAATTRAGSEGAEGANDSNKMLPTSPNHVGLLKEEQSSDKLPAAACSSNGLGELKTSSPSSTGEPVSSAPNGSNNHGPPGAARMESPKEVDNNKPTEPSTKQSSLAFPTLLPNNGSPPTFPAKGEQKLSPEKSTPSSLAPTGDPQQLPTTAKEPATGSQLSETRAEPPQHGTSNTNTTKPSQAAIVSAANGSNGSNGFDFFYQTSLLLGNDRIVPPVSDNEETDPSGESARKEGSVSPTCASNAVTCSWLPDLSLVDSNNDSVCNSRVEQASILGLYFSAEWCQPCRRFLPKLIRLYKILHKNQKPFEVIYVSNDNSEADMSRYMAEQNMPWVALPYGHALIKKLKRGYNVKSIPMLKIVSVDGSMINENARKKVEAANVESTVLKLFARWVTGEEGSPEERPKRKASSPSLLGSLKKSLGGEDSTSSSPEALRTEGKGQRGKEAAVEELLQKITEKDQKIRHLEEVNMSLKQTNDDLNEDVANLKMKVKQAEEKLEKLEQSTNRLRKEEQTLKAQMELRGWLFKRGAKGPTANVWRRRFFRLDQGSKICYYKTATERSPQGFIDLLKVVNVSEVSPAQQDKNNATFHVQCEGRTYQLQAVDETTMRKWMAAIEYLRGFYSVQGRE